MRTPIRVIKFEATVSGVTPTTPQFAGVQGDHQATQVRFMLAPALLNSAYRYRFEFVDGAGGFDSSGAVALEDNQTLSCLLPEPWTRAGGTGTIRLCAVLPGSTGDEEQVVYTLCGRLNFAQRVTGSPVEGDYKKNLTTLIEDSKEAAKAANDAAASADAAAASADAAAGEILAQRDAGLFNGEKGDKGERGEKGEKGDRGEPGPVGEKGEDGVGTVMTLKPGMFGLNVNADGHLILTHNDNEPTPPLSIQNGKLVYTIV